jgi:CubicO group peptidase (beta-lactamase class C family)
LSVVAGDVVEKAAFQLVTAFERRERRRLERHQRPALATVETPTSYHCLQARLTKTALKMRLRGQRRTPFAYAYTAADTVDLLVESMTGKSLSDLDAGEVHIYLAVTKLTSL